jgi:hypothetical protein
MKPSNNETVCKCKFLCRSLFVLLYFFFWPLCFLFFFDIRILITPLVYSNSFDCFLLDSQIWFAKYIFVKCVQDMFRNENAMVYNQHHASVLLATIATQNEDTGIKVLSFYHCTHFWRVIYVNQNNIDNK